MDPLARTSLPAATGPELSAPGETVFGFPREQRSYQRIVGSPVSLGDARSPTDGAPPPDAPPAHAFRPIDATIVIGAAGEVVEIEPAPAMAFGHRRKHAVLVPVIKPSQTSESVRFLWGRGGILLGSGGAGERARRVSDHQKRFKAFHEQLLGALNDTALQAFLRFLDRSAAPSVSRAPEWDNYAASKLVFRFQYDDQLLHERHAAQLAWKRFLSAGAD